MGITLAELPLAVQISKATSAVLQHEPWLNLGEMIK